MKSNYSIPFLLFYCSMIRNLGFFAQGLSDRESSTSWYPRYSKNVSLIMGFDFQGLLLKWFCRIMDVKGLSIPQIRTHLQVEKKKKILLLCWTFPYPCLHVGRMLNYQFSWKFKLIEFELTIYITLFNKGTKGIVRINLSCRWYMSYSISLSLWEICGTLCYFLNYMHVPNEVLTIILAELISFTNWYLKKNSMVLYLKYELKNYSYYHFQLPL